MSFGFWQIVVIALLGVLLFGRGRISDLMGEVAKGIKSFKKGMAGIDDETITTDKHIPPQHPTEMQDVTPSEATKKPEN